MRIDDFIKSASFAIIAQPLRALLILLAMSIGVASVMLLTALGDGARRYIVGEFEALGTHLVIILPGRTETTGGQPPLFGETPRDLSLNDAEAIAASRYIAAIAPISVGTAPVSTQGLERETTILGSTSALMRVRHLDMAEGRFLPAMEASKSLPVCVIGQTVKTELFGQQRALGNWLRVNDRRFRVIGVLAAEGQSIGVDFDEIVIIPVASAQALFNTSSLFRVLAEAKSKTAMLAAIDDIRRIIKDRHEGEDDVTIITQDSVVKTFDDILSALTMAVSSIAGISLLVAGILVMNVMLVSVSQRRAEIGLLKALGASQRQVRVMFLTEAAMLSIAGAIVGLLLGQAILVLLQLKYPDFSISLPSWAVFSAVAVALITGLLSGVLPAMKAARLNPIVALSKH